MKLLLCKECVSVFNLTFKEKTCECGKTKGKYLDKLNAEYSGPGVPIGFSNKSFIDAIRIQEFFNDKEKDNKDVCCRGEEFDSFVIPDWATSISKKE